MEKLEFKITIDAPREKIWKILWDEETYKLWTAPFSEGSRAETDWKKGSKILFLDSKDMGMISRVAENIENEYMSIEHLGNIMNGVEDLDSEEVKKWAGSHENYSLKTIDGQTELTIDMDITDEFKEMFNDIWPKALQVLKNLAETK